MEHNGTDPLGARDSAFVHRREAPLADDRLDDALRSLADEEIAIPDAVRDRMLRVIRDS